MDKSIFFHVSDQELPPSNSIYENITNIDNYDDGSIETIIIQNMCDYLKKIDVPLALEKIFQKLKSKGELYIQGTDLKQLGVALNFNMIESSMIKDILYPDKQSIHNMSDILKYLEDIGFETNVKKYSNIIEYYIVANKP
tara:strand:+ start:308 stop:727 length:420 start_codon:yes stop_codon:yes gene_type:complete